jgi:rRNA-processing protein FCF1
VRFFKKEEKTQQGQDAQKALKRYQAALMAFAHARDDAAVDYAVYEMEAAHREYALLSADQRAKEKIRTDCGVQAEHTVI